MLTLIIGGSGSGKSEYAEKLAMELRDSKAGMKTIYYLATMKPEGAENKKRISRHLTLRAGKGFVTIEQASNIEDALYKIEMVEDNKDNSLDSRILILECVSNLAANEMFDGQILSGDAATQKILSGIAALKNESGDFIVVSNNVHEDGIIYDELTQEYIDAVGAINVGIAAMADRVVEVVVGIPVVVK